MTEETPVLEDGAEQEQLEEEPQEPAEGEEQPEGVEQLGDAGKRALDSMKGKWRSERDKRRVLEERIAELEKPADSEQPDPDVIRKQAEQAALSKANERIVRAEVKVAAAGKLADPADALRFLDMASFEVDEDGQLDAEEVADAIDDLLKSKPYLSAQGGRRFYGTADSGARKGTGRPTQLTRADLAGMSPEQIRKAKADGRLADLLTGKN